MRLPGSGPLTYTRGTVISTVVHFCKVEAKRMSHFFSITILFLLAGFANVAFADIITFGGMITQAQDPTEPAANNPTLNNIQVLQPYLVTLMFTGSITAPGTYNLTGANLTFSDATAAATETS